MRPLLTAPQFVVLHLVWAYGLSQRAVARILGCSQVNVWKHYHKGLAALAERMDPFDPVDRVISFAICRRVFDDPRVSDVMGGPVQRKPPRVLALRRDDVAANLEALVEQRARELAVIREVMSGDHDPPTTRSKGKAWSEWELTYFRMHPHRVGIPVTTYNAGRAALYSPLGTTPIIRLSCST